MDHLESMRDALPVMRLVFGCQMNPLFLTLCFFLPGKILFTSLSLSLAVSHSYDFCACLYVLIICACFFISLSFSSLPPLLTSQVPHQGLWRETNGLPASVSSFHQTSQLLFGWGNVTPDASSSSSSRVVRFTFHTRPRDTCTYLWSLIIIITLSLLTFYFVCCFVFS